MPQLIKPQVIKTSSKDGEVEMTIKLELNINLNSDGIITASQSGNEIKRQNNNSDNNDDDVEWAIPDFSNSGKVKFGKKE